WWSPLFDFSREVYDLDASTDEIGDEIQAGKAPSREVPLEPEEKFKLLRSQLRESESWHDTMYHSAIASRLAT
ncbi:hypothetical protein SELMODRAFT_19119, partial [Selaginella moellendorffii]